MNKSTILFIPSNRNHVKIFSLIQSSLQNYRILFITQDSYKNEGAEELLSQSTLHYKKFDEFHKKDPRVILDQENVSLIIIGNDTDVIPQWFVNCANEKNIPSILIQDGLMLDIKTHRKIIKNYFSNRTKLKLKFLALKLLVTKKYNRISDGNGGCTQLQVWSNATKSFYINQGIEPSKIVITGNPFYKNVNYEKFVIRKEKKIVFAVSDLVETRIMTKQDSIQLFEIICSTFNQYPDVRLIIKPHPSDDLKTYHSSLQKFNSRIEISYDDISHVLQNSDLLITTISTTAIEAISCGKPVIIFFPNIEKIVDLNTFPYDLIEKNIVLYATDSITLKNQYEKIINGKFFVDKNEVEKMLKQYFGFGESIKDPSFYIESLINSNSLTDK